MNITRNGRSQEILLEHLKSRSIENLPTSCFYKGHPAIGSPDLLLQAHSFDQPPLDDGPALADGVPGLVGVHGPDGVHYLDLLAADVEILRQPPPVALHSLPNHQQGPVKLCLPKPYLQRKESFYSYIAHEDGRLSKYVL